MIVAKVPRSLPTVLRVEKPPLPIPQFGVFFDGTGNNLVNDMATLDDDREPTNVVKLFALYPENAVDKVSKIYIEGIGTTANEKDNVLDMGMAYTFGERVQKAVTKMIQYFETYPQSRIGLVDVFGFSRGAASARAFVNEVHRLTRDDAKTWGGLQPQFRFLGLFDTVGSVGIAGNNDNDNLFARGDLSGPIILDLHPGAIKRAVHLTAGDEMRTNFPLSSLIPRNRQMPSHFFEEECPGAHSDVGGGYGSVWRTIYYPIITSDFDEWETLPIEKFRLEVKQSTEKKYARPSIDIQVEVEQEDVEGGGVTYYAKPTWKRNVKKELSYTTLERMHQLAMEAKVPFKALSILPKELPYKIPDDLKELLGKVRKKMEAIGSNMTLEQRYAMEAYQRLYSHYIHHSHQHAIPDGEFINPNNPENNPQFTAANGAREIFYNDCENGIYIINTQPARNFAKS